MTVQSNQLCFREILDGMSYPGKIVAKNQNILDLAQVLVDRETGCHMKGFTEQQQTAFLVQVEAQLLSVKEAEYHILSDQVPEDEVLTTLMNCKVGTSISPEKSSFVLLESTSLSRQFVSITGPGIAGEKKLYLPTCVIEVRKKRNVLFPLGIDFFIQTEEGWIGLPRTTLIKEEEEWHM